MTKMGVPMFRQISKRGRGPAWLLLACLVLPLFLTGCGGGGSYAPPAPVDDSGYGRGSAGYGGGGGGGYGSGYSRPMGAPMAQPAGMSKTVMLAGAAALYYLYKKHQSAASTGPDGQYYLSRNGRVYYRDAEHRAHWVTPPPGGIQVPEHETRGLEGFQGYNNSSNGRDLSDLPESRY